MAQFLVTGMTCAGCARSVTNAIKSVDAGATVEVDLARKLVSVDSATDAEALAGAIRAAGFGVSAA